MDTKTKMMMAIQDHCNDLSDCLPTLESYGMTDTANEFRKAIQELKDSCSEEQFAFSQDNPDIP